jgi:hypothetical protein
VLLALRSATIILCLSCISAIAASPERIACGQGSPCQLISLDDLRDSAKQQTACIGCLPSLEKVGSCGGNNTVLYDINKVDQGRQILERFINKTEKSRYSSPKTRLKELPSMMPGGSRSFKTLEVLNLPTGQRQFVNCRRQMVKGNEGVPTDCRTVAVISPSQSFIAMDTAPSATMCLASSSVAPDLSTINFRFDVLSNGPIEPIASSISSMMKNELALDYDRAVVADDRGKPYSIRFSAVAPMRDSAILGGGFREIFNFTVSISRQNDGYLIDGATKPMICRTASGNAVEYHGLNDVQRSIYATSLDKRISEAVSRSCANFAAIDNETLQCR